MSRILLYILIALIPTLSVSVDDSNAGSRILLVAPPAMGHIIPLLRLGETLVKRGHQVGFCTTDIVGVNITREQCKKRGLTLVNAGTDPYTWYVKA